MASGVSSQMTAVGGMLGRYEVIKHLAQGGMAEVLLARTSGIEGFERYVVIKRIRWDQARDQQFVQMFLDEARLAAALHHNNILQVHDIGEVNGEYFFTMEYLHGQDLRNLMKRVVAREELVPLDQVVTIILHAASGLHFAHEYRGPDRQPLQIVHRDVSLSNIMVGYDGFVKVTDFGIAKAAQRSQETRSGVLKGKVAYMSPEQCLGKAVDRRSDVYSLGIVLYELVTARRLFKADSDFLTMSAIVDGAIPPPSTLRPDLPPELEAIILKALSRRAANRYQTADELRAALEDFAVSKQLRISGTALAAYMKRVFGDQPEPWVSDAPVSEPDDSDFDGSASGLVNAGNALDEDTPAPSSPIARAKRAETDVADMARGSGFVDELPARSKRGVWIGVGLVAVAAAALVVVLAMRGPTENAVGEPASGDTKSAPTRSEPTNAGTTSAGTTKTEATKPEATKPDATKPDATKPDATKTEAKKPDATKPDATKPDATKPDATKPDATKLDATKSDAPKGSIAKGDATKAGKQPVKRPATKPPEPKQPKWDPDELLPK